MKCLITLLVVFLFFQSSLYSQSPESISYQAVIRNNSDELLKNILVKTRFSIIQGSPDGNIVYAETYSQYTNNNGLFTVEIGRGNTIVGDFTQIDWENGPYFLKSETDPNGGNNYSITGTSQFLSVPYALFAKTSGSSLPGPQGEPGVDGINGKTTYELAVDNGYLGSESEWLTSLQGKNGTTPSHEWDGTNLRFQNSDSTWGAYVDLKGEQGLKGDMPEHEWNGTKLRFQNPDSTWGSYTDLNGARGLKGDMPQHQWSGTKLRFQNSDNSWGVYTDLIGTQGRKGDSPEHQWNGTKIRFKHPNGSWGVYVDLKGTPGPSVKTFAICAKNVGNSTCNTICSGKVLAGKKVLWHKDGIYTNCGTCQAKAETGSCSASSCSHDGYAICCVCTP